MLESACYFVSVCLNLSLMFTKYIAFLSEFVVHGNVENKFAVMYVICVCLDVFFARQVQDLCFFDDGNKFLSCNDIVGRDSPDRTIMIWDFSSAAVLSNQIFHVSVLCAYNRFDAAFRLVITSLLLG